jgi:hypothetical protein
MTDLRLVPPDCETDERTPATTTALRAAGLRPLLAAHLADQFIPAQPEVWIEPAIEAIEAAEAQQWDRHIEITDVVKHVGLSPRGAVEDGGRVVVNAGTLLRALKLHAFVVVGVE